jgi:hypothetical protein
MTAHKEAAVDESRQHARLGATCVTAFSEVIASSSFNSAADFFDAVQAAWDEQWLQVFSADPEGAEEIGCGQHARDRVAALD